MQADMKPLANLLRPVYVAAFVLFGLGACALKAPPSAQVLRDQQLPALAGKDTWAAATNPGESASGWVADFNDPQLNQLVSEAIANNRNLLMAASRVEQAQALVAVNGGSKYPALALRGVGGNSETQIASIGISWELDFWGRVRSQARAAESQYAASQADYAWAEQSLAATVTMSWFSALQYSQMITRSQKIVEAQESLLTIAQQRVRTGISPDSELEETRIALQIRKSELKQLELARTQAILALEVLLGRYPALALQAEQALPLLPPAPNAGLPANLLERRPDLVAAERRVAAAFDLQQSAEAARLPTISISAAITAISSDVFLISNGGSPISGLSGSIFAPIFSGGKLKGQADYYTAVQQEAAAAYGSLALVALKEVESSLRSEQNLAEQAAFQNAQVKSKQDLVKIEDVRVGVGSRDPRSALTSRQALYAAEMSLLQLQAAQLNQRVALLLALGGSWNEPGSVEVTSK